MTSVLSLFHSDRRVVFQTRIGLQSVRLARPHPRYPLGTFGAADSSLKSLELDLLLLFPESEWTLSFQRVRYLVFIVQQDLRMLRTLLEHVLVL